MNDKDYPVTLLKGSWPEWFGNIGMRFIYVRIRGCMGWIGVGGSHNDAMNRAEVVKECPEYYGVLEDLDAISLLRENGYRVKSVVVLEHVEELSE
jgi:hypothetical protein